MRRRQPHTAGSPTHRQAESSGATLSRNPLTGLPAQPLTQAPIRPPAHPARPLTRPAGPPQLMYKLRKELGETDFNKIFNNVKVKGFDIEY